MRTKTKITVRFALMFALISSVAETQASAQYTAKTIFTFFRFQGCTQTPTGVVFDSQGNLLGTANGSGCSNLFELSPTSGGGWTETLHYFGFPYGAQLSPGVALDSSGNIYYTALTGENGWQCAVNCGAVLEFPTPGAIHLATVSDGYHPNPVIIDSAGNVYGTTQAGGSSDPSSQGVVYKLSRNSSGGWVETVLHRFTGGNDGGVPMAGLIVDANGVLYGTASQGGLYGYGTVYTLTPNGTGGYTFAWVHAFDGAARGGNPMSPLLIDASGNIFGTTIHGAIARCVPKTTAAA